MFKSISKMPVSRDDVPDTKSQANILNKEINFSNTQKLDNTNNLFASYNLGIKLQDKNNNNLNNNYQQVSNKRRINEDFNSNDCNDQLNKKFKHGETDTEEQTSKVYILVASIKVYLFCHLATY